LNWRSEQKMLLLFDPVEAQTGSTMVGKRVAH